jgi:choline dehydrogenase-like flavoprotein
MARLKVTEGAACERDLALDCDVVVVGSGAGGGATAAELAEGGLDVVVLEEGGYHDTGDYTTNAGDMLRTLYRNAGTALIWGRPNIVFAEGRCLGGSTVINGGMCWRTPERILKRWDWEFGVQGVDPARMEPVFDRVEQRINVAYQRPDSVGRDAELFKAAAEKLGYHPKPARRNQKDCVGTDNCAFGCPSGAKQSTLLSYLPRAAHHGARIYTDARVLRIDTAGGRAAGVRGVVTNPATGRTFDLRVRARAVVAACGAVQTPALLLRSRLCRTSGRLGRNFLCHPNSKVVGVFRDPVRAWEGTHQQWCVHDLLDEGLILATTFAPPSILASSLPLIGDDGLDLMRRIDRLMVGGVLVEDSESGRVRLGWGGEPLMQYDLRPRDLWLLRRGVALLAEIMFAGGAERVLTPFFPLPRLDGPDDIRRIFSVPIRPQDLDVFTVHAMGTAHMGADPRRSVVDSYGEAHDVKGLFVNDASLFPTGLGVNPQITVMALATRNSQRLLERWSDYR